MPQVDPGRRRAHRALGAAIGAAGALAAGHGAVWSGHAQSLPVVAGFALLVGASLGALTWGLFEPDPRAPAWWFTALFGGAVGMLAGGFAGFPVGAVFGAGGGALGGTVAGAAWRLSAPPRTGWDVVPRGAVAGVAGAMGGLVVALWMAS
ncbi:MAG: hypothetical protein QF464_19345 [Myxococcota bacterium]|nr:hypothetical protein [Myxococcota bacterium]